LIIALREGFSKKFEVVQKFGQAGYKLTFEKSLHHQKTPKN